MEALCAGQTHVQGQGSPFPVASAAGSGVGGLTAHPQGITLCQKKPPAQVHPFLQAVLPSTGPLEFKGLPGCLGLGRFLKDHSPELQQLNSVATSSQGPCSPRCHSWVLPANNSHPRAAYQGADPGQGERAAGSPSTATEGRTPKSQESHLVRQCVCLLDVRVARGLGPGSAGVWGPPVHGQL